MKILNLYSGIGGNRKMWNGHEITAIEIDEAVAGFYQKLFPEDKVIVCDAHDFLLNNFDKFDFIWSSPPCPTHSDIRRCGVKKGQYPVKYPNMSLYEEIILLRHFAKEGQKWVVENVKPYYKMLIPAIEVERHLFWSNFNISQKYGKSSRKHDDIIGSSTVYGFNISNSNIKDKRKTLRNCVNPYLGKHILDCAISEKNNFLFK